MKIISEVMVVIQHSDWNSTNERKFRIDLKAVNDFKLLVNAMKKHTRLAKKEIVGDVSIELLKLSPTHLERGVVEPIDHKRFIIFERMKVNRMIFNYDKKIYESKDIFDSQTIYEATNFIFNDIHTDLKESRKALKEFMKL